MSLMAIEEIRPKSGCNLEARLAIGFGERFEIEVHEIPLLY